MLAGDVDNYSQIIRLGRLLKIARFIRVLRLLRVLKLKRLLSKFEELVFNDDFNMVMDVIKLMIIIFFIAHWMSCFYYAVPSF